MNWQAHKSGNRSERSKDLETLFNRADIVVCSKENNEILKTELEKSNKKLENLKKNYCNEIDNEMKSFGKKESPKDFAKDFVKQLVDAKNFEDVLEACTHLIDLMLDPESVESENFKDLFKMICSIFKKITQGSFFLIYSSEDTENVDKHLVVLMFITNIFQCFIVDDIDGIKLNYLNIEILNKRCETLEDDEMPKLKKLYDIFLKILREKTDAIKSDSEDSSNATTRI
ncbi:MAG: hypothetical protein MHPSP_003911 [Paramarteilia canceri]